MIIDIDDDDYDNDNNEDDACTMMMMKTALTIVLLNPNFKRIYMKKLLGHEEGV